MTQGQIAQLFGRDRSSITKHINNIIENEELDARTSVQKVHKSLGRPVALYNLDMVISVGYRVSSRERRQIADENIANLAREARTLPKARKK